MLDLVSLIMCELYYQKIGKYKELTSHIKLKCHGPKAKT